MELCRICGARLFEGTSFCTQCHAPIEATEEEIARARVEIAAAAGRWHKSRTPAERWKPDPRFTRACTSEYSRWRRSTLSLGPATKIAITIFLGLVPIVTWMILPLFALEFVLVWCVIVVPLVLRDLWKRVRIR